MLLIADHVSYVYGISTPYEKKALDDISLTINEGEFIGIIGHTGSGKSTLIQHFNGLEKATTGKIYFKGQDIYEKDFNLKELRSKVGLVFQYPEHQLFETTVLEDVKFGPKNLGLDKINIDLRAFEAIKKVGLSEEFYDASPFELSGGQKRRVAIAGVLAMKPEILILDEPTAGLDPAGRDEILDQLAELNRAGLTIILVSHSMEDVAKYADRVIAMDDGKIVFDDAPRKVFKRCKELEDIGLSAPQVTYIMEDMKTLGFQVNSDVLTVEEAKTEILRVLRRRND